jgi:hypothetical protein
MANDGHTGSGTIPQDISRASDADIGKKVRGRPFPPGNPGRPPGAKNKTTRLVEQLLDDEAETLMRTLIQLALKGNVRCLHDCLERLAPRRNGRPVDFQIPAIKQTQDIVAAMAAVTTAVNSGDLTAEEAGHLVHVLEVHVKAIEAYDLAIRLERLEAQMKPRDEDAQHSSQA